ncbi:uncharacterized protein PV09_07405 [Verruconis gallopava]|uniref:Uncharacterized protein n=1 Tax=Verruconis gallopava TaxID=253628 RepID=A0A0D1YJT0_9PEZI|nr:uncharacterized protein PV09_07405 [Verruconis gallopava]KIW01117.1 hypothetical protein PV09_07405 [Verruconis gallopava]
MPICRGISVTILTPFALDGLPETVVHTRTLSKSAEDDGKFASVFIPAHAQSLFWLSYSVEAPSHDAFLVFSLFIQSHHIVTWSCDADEDWRGKVQFTLFKKDVNDVVGGAGMEKRVFQFGDVLPAHDEERCIEVRVCRANKKLRIPRQLGDNTSICVGSSFQLSEAGKTKRAHPRKFYAFGLLDPKDDPYATFRFYCRTDKEIATLNSCVSQMEDRKVLTAPSAKSLVKNSPSGQLIMSEGNESIHIPRKVHQRVGYEGASSQLLHAPCMPTLPNTTLPATTRRTDIKTRLSIPPSTILRPLFEHGPLPASPRKSRCQGTDPKFDQKSGQASKENMGGKVRWFLQGTKMRKGYSDTAATAYQFRS